MDWTATVIWWHCYPLRFVGGETRAVTEVYHRLTHLVNWFDYVVELGANGVLMAPIFASSTHGYDTLDHFRIDPRLGDETDFEALMDAATSRGLRICLDGVFNHLSRNHEIVQKALEAGPGTEAGRWLRWEGEHPRVFEGHAALVEIDLAHPPVADFVVSVMTHWLAKGIHGWRLDAAYAPGAATWRPIVDRVKAEYPDCWILGEVIHGDYAEFVTTSGVDTVTQYELWHAVSDSLNNHNLFSLDWTLGRHQAFCRTFRPQTFIGNHDVIRIATQLRDPRHLEIAIALLLLLPGIPSIYAGDEQAFTGEKLHQRYGDDAIRPPFPLHPQEMLPFGASIHESYQRLIGLRRRHPWLVDAELSTADVTNETITITLTGPDETRRLLLNISDEEHEGTPPHSWRLT